MNYIYYIECVPSGKKYIGKSASSFIRRWLEHIGELRRGIKKNTPFGAEWEKYPSLIYWRFGLLDEGDFSGWELTGLETKRITDIPFEKRLNAPKTSILSEEKRRKIADLIMAGKRYEDICSIIGCSSGYISVVKSKMVLSGHDVQLHKRIRP